MLRDLKAVKKPEELAGSYVILDRRHFNGMNDLRIRHSYDEFGSFVKVPPEEWTLLGSKNGVEIYDVPEGWSYSEPDGKELAVKELLHAFQARDIMLFRNALHPDFSSRLTGEQEMSLIRTLENVNDPNHAKLLNERLEYREYNGIWKIQFRLD